MKFSFKAFLPQRNHLFYEIIVIIIFFTCSCSLGGGQKGPNYYFKPILVEYNIANKTYSQVKAFDVTNMGYDIPFFQYLNENNKVIFIQHRKITILDTKSKRENSINLDSLLVKDNYFSLSPTENRIVFCAFSSAISSGLYLLDLDSKIIHILKHFISTNSPFPYNTPKFSNNGKLITFASLTGIAKMDLATHEDQIIHSGGSFPTFDKSDEKIVLLEDPQKILAIHLGSNHVDTIDNSHYHATLDLLGYPNFLVTKTNVYYTGETALSYPQVHQIFVYEYASKKSTYLTDGIMPMSENPENGNLIIRTNCNYEDKGSPIIILTHDGKIIETLKSGYRATFSPDGSKVLLLILEEVYVD